MKLQNKIALVTGGNSGIGLATAKLFNQEGAQVIITGRRPEAIENTIQEIGDSIKGIVSDTSNLDEVKALYKQIDEQYGKLDVLFLNAGVAVFEPIEMVTEETFDKQFNINIKGLFFNIQQVLPLLKDGGSIILTTSAADQKGFPLTSVYAATKAAVRSLSRTLSSELSEKGIRINSVAPGPIETPIYDKLGFPSEAVDQMKAGFTETTPMKRFGTSEEVAKSVLFLASDDSSYITGIDLSVDGGIVSV
ncbi:MAG: hypothetical protein COA88_09005 [Kordia sp.]|nr:MAG: hypothetical protein COA88_09005 [Kordia sp.]